MKKTKKTDWNRRISLLTCAIMLSVSGCIPSTTSDTVSATASPAAQAESDVFERDRSAVPGGFTMSDTSAAVSTQPAPAQADISARDRDGSYDDASAVHITCSGDAVEIDSVGATWLDGVLSVTRAGTYVLRGTLNGGVAVSATSNDTVQLVLDGVQITNADGPALNVTQADKVLLTLAAGTENALADGAAYATLDSDGEPDACVFCKDDLTVNGTGALSVTGNYRHGVVTKDTLAVIDAQLTVMAVNDGLKGTDAVYLGGAAAVSVEAGSDSIHTKGDFVLESGTVTLSAGDDGVHADENLTVRGGALTVTNSFEGLEALMLCILDGDISITASDDGLNATASAEQSETGDAASSAAQGGAQPQPQADAFPDGTPPELPDGARPDWGGGGEMGGDQDTFAFVEGALIAISGGTLTVDAGGDALDSNGDLLVSGGTVLVSGAINGADGAIDYNGGAAITGGVFLGASAAGMAAQFGTSSTQPSLLATVESTVTGGTEAALFDASGQALARFTPAKDWQSVLISVPEMVDGQTYTLSAGGDVLCEVTLSGMSTVYGDASQAGMRGFGGGAGGGRGGKRGDGVMGPPDTQASSPDGMPGPAAGGAEPTADAQAD